KLRFHNIQENVFFAKGQLKEAERISRGGSDTQMRNGLKRAEETLGKAAKSCEEILAGVLNHRARKVFEDLKRHINRELLDAHLLAGKLYLAHKLWTDAEKAIGKAEELDPDSTQAKSLREWLKRAWR
ncbi:MAG: hypothetical protein ACYTFG_07160, partial [Planctomycetota bacterium]